MGFGSRASGLVFGGLGSGFRVQGVGSGRYRPVSGQLAEHMQVFREPWLVLVLKHARLVLYTGPSHYDSVVKKSECKS